MNLTFGVLALVKAFVDSEAATENMKTLNVFIIFSRMGLGKMEFWAIKKMGTQQIFQVLECEKEGQHKRIKHK